MRDSSFWHVLHGFTWSRRLLTSLLDLKPGNILLVPTDLDAIVMREIAEQPSTLYEFPKTIPPNELPFHPVVSTPLLFDLNPSQATRLHWVIADLGHGALVESWF